MTELLSCPFCGGDVSFHKDEECPGCHLVQCGQCRAFFDFATGADPGNDCESVDALRAAIAPMWNRRTQLAAIQGGMGEVVEVAATYCADMMRAVPSGLTHLRDKEQLVTLAQHQRITAALAAEVERLREDYDKAWRHAGENLGKALADNTKLRAELAAYKAISPYRIRRLKAVTKERDALRAELAEVKGREAVGEVQLRTGGGISLLHVDLTQPLPPGTKLYTTPPASPDVEGLVKALEAADEYLSDNRFNEIGSGSILHRQMQDALSTWRQAQASQQKGKA